ncbi:DUF456 family protein [Candidatus Omnitrophota bacterium]
MDIAALVILILFNIAGFVLIFFTTFGTLIILAGSVLYAVLTGFSPISFKGLLILGALYLFGEILEYVLIIAGIKKFGASNKAIIGALLGGIIGAAAGVALLGIGVFISTLLGIFFGAFSAELISHRDLVRSAKAGAGGVLGRVLSIVAKVPVALGMIFVQYQYIF